MKAIFMLGLPGSGKSNWLTKFISNNPGYTVISADEYRLKHPNYNPNDPEAIHEECVAWAESEMYRYGSGQYTVIERPKLIMDGGGINNSYTERIIHTMKSYGYEIEVVFIDTPPSICISRNNDRIKNGKRFVPASSIIDKSYRLRKSIKVLSAIADKFVVVKHFSDKHIFCDLDGTLAEYQQLVCDEYGDVNFVEYGVFEYSKPINEMIQKLSKLHKDGKRIYIVSASPNSICNVDKKNWVNKHLPFIYDEDIYFVGKKEFKYVFLYQLIKKLKLDPKDCMAIDDDHRVLETYGRLQINSMHPSYFLTNY